MKRLLSILLSISFLFSAVFITAAADDTSAAKRIKRAWYRADFENGELGDNFGIRANYDNGAPTAEYEIEENAEDGKFLHIKNRSTNYGGLEIDVSEMIKNTVVGEGEGYSVGFRMKAEAGESFRVAVLLYGCGDGYLEHNYISWEVTDKKWTEIALNKYFFSKVDEFENRSWTNGGSMARIVFLTSDGSQGDTGNPVGASDNKGYFIDDIIVSGPASVGDTIRTSKEYYSADFNNELMGDAAIRNDEGYVGTEFVDDGFGGKALHFTRRPVNYEGLKINVSEMLKAAEIKSDNEGYRASFRIKAEAGKSFWLRVEMYGVTDRNGRNLGNGYLGSIEAYFYVTDEWTAIGADNVVFMGGEGYDRYWANNAAAGTIGFVTIAAKPDGSRGDGTTDNFYIDDIKIYAPSDKVITEDEDTYTPSDEPEASVAPIYAMTDKTNLIAPYGDFESYSAGDKIWNQDNELFSLITDAAIAHSGNNCLLVSGRESKFNTAVLDVTSIVKTQGSGKYYLSFYAKTASGKTGLCPTLRCYYGTDRNNYKDYYLPGRYLVTADTQWKQLGVEPNQSGYYFSQEDKLTGYYLTIDTARLSSAEIIFYGNLEEDDGFADYYLDDVKFWKYYNGQEGGKPAENPSVRVEPKYDYKNKLNLLGDYGSFENVATGCTLWNGTVIEDKNTAFNGSKYLKISNRDPAKSPFNFCVYVTDIINANGAGKYYYSCRLKTAEKGKTTTLQPYLYFHETGTVYEMSSIFVTDKWTHFGVTYGEVEQYINNANGGLPLTNGVAEFRFYNAKNEDEYPDYLVDDMAFWRYTDEQLKYAEELARTGEKADFIPISAVFCLAVLCISAAGAKFKREQRA